MGAHRVLSHRLASGRAPRSLLARVHRWIAGLSGVEMGARWDSGSERWFIIGVDARKRGVFPESSWWLCAAVRCRVAHRIPRERRGVTLCLAGCASVRPALSKRSCPHIQRIARRHPIMTTATAPSRFARSSVCTLAPASPLRWAPLRRDLGRCVRDVGGA